jgi:hypothetical protein
VSFTLNRKGGAEVLNALAAEYVNDLAKQIAAQTGVPDVEVEQYTTDRAAASVSVPAHLQAKDGALTKAAAAIGVEVKLKPPT